jgi:hypothetical protein
VQCFIETLPEKIEDIVALIRPHLVQLAIDNCGCCVVQRLFDRYDVETLKLLVGEVLLSAAELATNQYGNYVVQNILEARRPEHVSALVAAFRGHFYEFSMHKFASNVTEKCIREAIWDGKKDLRNQGLKPEASGSQRRLSEVEDGKKDLRNQGLKREASGFATQYGNLFSLAMFFSVTW